MAFYKREIPFYFLIKNVIAIIILRFREGIRNSIRLNAVMSARVVSTRPIFFLAMGHYLLKN